MRKASILGSVFVVSLSLSAGSDLLSVCDEQHDPFAWSSKDHAIESRNPFAWDEQASNKKETKLADKKKEEQVVPVVVQKPLCSLMGISVCGKEVRALVAVGDQPRILKQGNELEDGWVVNKITKDTMSCEHRTGEHWASML